MKRWFALALAAMLLACMAGCREGLLDAARGSALAQPSSSAEASAEAAQTNDAAQSASVGRGLPENGSVFPDFSAKTLSGTAMDNGVFAGQKLTVLHFYTTWCGPCIDELSVLNELNGAYREQGVLILGVAGDAKEQTARRQMSKAKASYSVLLPDETLLDVFNRMSYVPTTFFVDQNGRLVGEPLVGTNSYADWEQIIQKRLEEAG